jgi:hypothetical protein
MILLYQPEQAVPISSHIFDGKTDHLQLSEELGKVVFPLGILGSVNRINRSSLLHRHNVDDLFASLVWFAVPDSFVVLVLALAVVVFAFQPVPFERVCSLAPSLLCSARLLFFLA